MAEQKKQSTEISGIKRNIHEINTSTLPNQPSIKRRRLNDSKKPSLLPLINELSQTTFEYKPALIRYNKINKNKKEDDISECSRSLAATISVSSISHKSVPLNKEITNMARIYYLHIVNDTNKTFQEQKDKIYQDLVIGSRSDIKMNENECNKFKNNENNKFELKYQIGIKNQEIKTIYGSLFTFGRFPENDICSDIHNQSISRIQCFIFIIDDSLIIMDGWSFLGTKTIRINHNKHDLLYNSMPNKRVLLRFNKTDTIHLRFGDSQFEVDLIINPKECVICMDKARVIRNYCGHYVLCKNCYHDMLTQSSAQCPICRASMKRKPVMDNSSIATFHAASNSSI